MIIGSLSTRTVNRQDLGTVSGPASGGNGVSTATRSGGAATAAAGGASAAGANFVSPFGRYDYTSHLEILQFRDATTGKVSLQIPSERVVEAYRQTAAYSGPPQTAHTTATAQVRHVETPPAAPQPGQGAQATRAATSGTGSGTSTGAGADSGTGAGGGSEAKAAVTSAPSAPLVAPAAVTLAAATPAAAAAVPVHAAPPPVAPPETAKAA